jgi:hypothetical protein
MKLGQFFFEQRNPTQMILYESSNLSIRGPPVKARQKLQLDHKVIRAAAELLGHNKADLVVNI